MRLFVIRVLMLGMLAYLVRMWARHPGSVIQAGTVKRLRGQARDVRGRPSGSS